MELEPDNPDWKGEDCDEQFYILQSHLFCVRKTRPHGLLRKRKAGPYRRLCLPAAAGRGTDLQAGALGSPSYRGHLKERTGQKRAVPGTVHGHRRKSETAQTKSRRAAGKKYFLGILMKIKLCVDFPWCDRYDETKKVRAAGFL